jgi:phosphatidylglycerol:prolipoprotein diacylglycerol transferase
MSVGEVFTALGYAVGALVFYLAARSRRLATHGMGWLALIGLFGGLIGAKLTQFVAQGWPNHLPAESALDPRLGGRALLGGLVGGWLAVEIAKRKLGIKRSSGDMFALALAAGEVFGRIGCYFNGCCYGAECDLPWAVFQHGALRHPAQIYSAITAAAIFGVLIWRWKAAHEGETFRLYLLLFGASRFLIEFTRYRETLYFGLSPMQWLCLELVLVVGGMMVWRRHRSKPTSLVAHAKEFTGPS